MASVTQTSNYLSSKADLLSAAADARELLANSWRTEVVNFQNLRNIDPQSLVKISTLNSPQHTLLRHICLMTQTTMRNLNASHPGLPPDTMQKTVDLCTHPGAKVILLKGILPREERLGDQVLGYGIVMLGRDNIIDKANIPSELLVREDTCRVIRLFVTPTAREFMPRGEAFTKLTDAAKLLCGDAPIVGALLTDLKILKGVSRLFSADPWLDALRGMTTRGFRLSGYKYSHTFSHPKSAVLEKDTDVEVTLEWATFSRAQAAQDSALKEQENLYRRRKIQTFRQLASVAAAVPHSAATVYVSARPEISFDIARLYPRNTIVAGSYGSNRKLEVAANLIRLAPGSPTALASDTSDASLLIGAVPDIVGPNNDKKLFSNFIHQQYEQLKLGGRLVVRDSVASEEDRMVVIRLSTDRVINGKKNKISPAEAFREFINTRTERHITSDQWESVVPQSKEKNPANFLAPISVINEFRLKLAYYKDWEIERLRPYTAFTAKERSKIVSEAGFRVISDGRLPALESSDHYFSVYNSDGTEPINLSSNYQVTLAEKVGMTDGVEITVENSIPQPPDGFQQIRASFKLSPDLQNVLGMQETGFRTLSKTELATHDIIPFIENKYNVLIQGRSMPRPLTVGRTNLDGFSNGGYITEQIGAVVNRESLQSAEKLKESAVRILAMKCGISPDQIVEILPSSDFFSRPEILDEQVHTTAVRLLSVPLNQSGGEVYGLATKPKMHLIEATQVLQSSQVGGGEDHRLELGVYNLLADLGKNPGLWLGKVLPLSVQETSHLHCISAEDVVKPAARKQFIPANIPSRAGFLQTVRSTFAEKNSHGDIVGRAELDHVETAVGRKFSGNAMAILPIVMRPPAPLGEDRALHCTAAATGISLNNVLVGVRSRDFESVQAHTGSSALFSLPTPRLPNSVTDIGDGARWAKQRLNDFLKLSVRSIQPLGGKYRTSPGNTSEVIYPMIAEVDVANSPKNDLCWVPLGDLLSRASEIKCAQLRTAVYRTAHMLGWDKLEDPVI